MMSQQLFSTTAGLKTLLMEPEDTGVEHFVDAPEVGEKAKETSVVKDALHDQAYDGKKRDPQHANAQGSCLWELVSL